MITVFSPPSGPGVRLDAGYAAGIAVPQAYDSLIGKLIVTGASRAGALERAARALGEFEVGGMPTVLPFHRAIVTDPAFAAPDGSLRVHTRWIETEFSASLPPQDPASVADPPDREKLAGAAAAWRSAPHVLRNARAVPPARPPPRPPRTRSSAPCRARSSRSRWSRTSRCRPAPSWSCWRP